MPETQGQSPVVDEVLWNAWIARGKHRERKTARLVSRVAIGVALAAAVAGSLAWLM